MNSESVDRHGSSIMDSESVDRQGQSFGSSWNGVFHDGRLCTMRFVTFWGETSNSQRIPEIIYVPVWRNVEDFWFLVSTWWSSLFSENIFHFKKYQHRSDHMSVSAEGFSRVEWVRARGRL